LLRRSEIVLRAWMTMMAASDISREAMDRMRRAYTNDVGVLPPRTVASIIAAGGFEPPVQLFQAGLIHAWRSSEGKAVPAEIRDTAVHRVAIAALTS